MKICIDAGHGGKDPGAVAFDLKEKDANLDIALKIQDILKRSQFEVYMTRKEDITLPLYERADIINAQNCDICISIHNNGAVKEEAFGSEVIYPAGSSKGKELGELILDNLGKLGLKKRRVFNRLNSKGKDYYYIIRNVNALSIIIEGAFVTNKKDNELLKNDEFRTKMANAISQGIIKFTQKYFNKPQKHWAEDNFQRLKDENLVYGEHDLNSNITWGEFATVIARLLDKEKN